ncbi:MAG: hypothetical protein COV36_00215 [Alphaproteobacteria bacterium CG11_big_fil_rev_8_21_14_0_20_44_7]|nr:MAG: hypothetical protein COV36_00215 [Alphaproteobacteria bacterium CG11_big_fil_rev_8_21_14_0_20_44_7]
MLHIVAVVGILAFEVLKPRQNELDEAPERTPGLLGKHFLDAIASDQSILNNPARLEALLDAASVPEDSSAILWYDSWGEVQIPVTRAKALENAELAEEVLLDRAKQIEVPRTR